MLKDVGMEVAKSTCSMQKKSVSKVMHNYYYCCILYIIPAFACMHAAPCTSIPTSSNNLLNIFTNYVEYMHRRLDTHQKLHQIT